MGTWLGELTGGTGSPGLLLSRVFRRKAQLGGPLFLAGIFALFLGFITFEENAYGDEINDGAALVAPFGTYQPALAGTYTFDVILQGKILMGSLTVEVGPAPKKKRAVYQVHSVMRMNLAGGSYDHEETALLDAKFATLSDAVHEEDTKPGDGILKITNLSAELKGKKWTYQRTNPDGTREKFTTKASGPVYGDIINWFLVFRAIDRSNRGVYRFQALTLATPEGPLQIEESLVRFGAPEPFIHRDQEVGATVFSAKNNSDTESTLLAVDSDGRILAIWGDDVPVKLIACEGDECGQELKPAIGVDDPSAAIEVYLSVMAKTRAVSALDEVTDWEAVASEMLSDEFQGVLTTEAFSSMFKAELAKNEASITPEQVAVVMALLEAVVEGDKATVTMPGRENDPFVLVRTMGTWKITHFPH